MLSLSQLHSVCSTSNGRSAATKYLSAMNEHMPRYGIDTPARVSAFLAQIAHESQDFTRVVENLNYSDPKRIAQIFRSGFDLDRDRVVDAEEIEFAKGYVRSPQKLANRAYANRMGNGDEASGDGFAYRGRGLKQLTGKNNYQACGDAIGVDLVSSPDLLLAPDCAVESACWFWRENKLSPLADRGDIKGITLKINGGLNGLAERQAYMARAADALAVTA